MRRFAVIGLGRFGSRLAESLGQAGQEVIAVDQQREIVESLRDAVTLAVTLDATDEQALRSQGVEQVDVAVVAIGDDFQANVLATVLLKQMGVGRVISRAPSPMAAQVLRRVGADEVVNPEDESADRWCVKLLGPAMLRQFELAEGQSLVEIETPSSWVGKTLLELKPRSELGVLVVAVRRFEQPAEESEQEQARGREVLSLPDPEQPLREGDVLVLVGRDDDLAKLPSR